MSTPWADQPFPLIVTPMSDGTEASKGSLYVATNMAYPHNLMIRYLNSIYLQATGVTKPKDIADFLFYCQSWCGVVHEHHKEEETKFFPLVETYAGEKGIMDECLEEHRAFETGFHVFDEYVKKTKPEEYDGKKIRSLINDFAVPLVKHLRAEIKKLIDVGEKYGGEKFQILFHDFETKLLKEAQGQWDPHVVIPSAIGAIDRQFEGGKHRHWPPFPWFVPLLSRFIFSRKHAGSWRFSPCRNFKRKELEFVGEGWELAAASVVSSIAV